MLLQCTPLKTSLRVENQSRRVRTDKEKYTLNDILFTRVKLYKLENLNMNQLEFPLGVSSNGLSCLLTACGDSVGTVDWNLSVSCTGLALRG